MQSQRFKPLFDKLYLILLIPTAIVVLGATAMVLIFPEPVALVLIILVDLFVLYFFVSPLFGYVELRESSVFIKYGFFLKKEIPYEKIRGVVKDRKFYSDSIMSLKNSFEHVNIKYNAFDVTSVSVVDNDEFIETLEERLDGKHLSKS